MERCLRTWAKTPRSPPWPSPPAAQPRLSAPRNSTAALRPGRAHGRPRTMGAAPRRAARPPGGRGTATPRARDRLKIDLSIFLWSALSSILRWRGQPRAASASASRSRGACPLRLAPAQSRVIGSQKMFLFTKEIFNFCFAGLFWYKDTGKWPEWWIFMEIHHSYKKKKNHSQMLAARRQALQAEVGCVRGAAGACACTSLLLWHDAVQPCGADRCAAVQQPRGTSGARAHNGGCGCVLCARAPCSAGHGLSVS